MANTWFYTVEKVYKRGRNTIGYIARTPGGYTFNESKREGYSWRYDNMLDAESRAYETFGGFKGVKVLNTASAII